MKRCPPCLILLSCFLLLAGSCTQVPLTPSEATAAGPTTATGTAPLKERYTITYERDYIAIAGDDDTPLVKPIATPDTHTTAAGLPAGRVPVGQGAPADAGAPPTGSPTVVLDASTDNRAVSAPDKDDCEYFQLPITPTPPRLPDIPPEVARDDKRLNLVLVSHIEAVRNHIYNARKLIRGEYKKYMERCHPDKKVVFDYRVQ